MLADITNNVTISRYGEGIGKYIVICISKIAIVLKNVNKRANKRRPKSKLFFSLSRRISNFLELSDQYVTKVPLFSRMKNFSLLSGTKDSTGAFKTTVSVFSSIRSIFRSGKSHLTKILRSDDRLNCR